jgi:1-acyl-sn-glycerol-3-phosphate acyltransferase
MKKQRTIDEWSLFYWFLQVTLVRPIHNYFYRKIKVVNADRIPKGKAVILAPNHQNALMDAMAFVAAIKYQTVFLARADVFRGGIVSKILTFLKILPIYRIRDGISSLQKNDEIFDITLNILRNKINPLCIFPEGNHGDKRRLRPLVKGIFRIAFKAQEDYKSQPGVKIVPVGIDYSHYWKFRQTQLINFGKPIEVSEYWQAYEENPTIAINLLRERLAEEMKKYMIHIESEDYYNLYMGIRVIYRSTMCKRTGLKTGDLYDEFLVDKKLIGLLDECLRKQPGKIAELNNVYYQYLELRNTLNFRDWVPVKKKYSIILNSVLLLGSIVVWPLVLLGIFNNWPHFFIPVRFQKGIKDTQFFSTAKWGAGFAILVIYYLILSVLALIFLPVWWIKILYLITLPSSGIFALDYRNFVIKAWARIRYSFSIRNKNSRTARFKSLYDQIFSLTNAIVDNA